MSKLHTEAFTEWTATTTIAAAAGNGTLNGPAAQPTMRNFVLSASVSFAGATVTTVGTITMNFGAANTYVFQVPVGSTGLYLNLSWTKAVRCDINFQPTIVLAGFTAAGAPATSINMGGYKVRE